MRSFVYFAVALGLSQLTSSCKTQAYPPQQLQARALNRAPLPQNIREQSLDAAQSDYIENLPGLGLALSSDRLGKSAWASGKFKVTASCRETFQLTIEGSTIRNVTNFQTFEGCVTLARSIDNLEVPSSEQTEEHSSGGVSITASCRDDFFTLHVSEGSVHINSDYLVPNADACIELRNRVNSLKL